MSQEMQISEVLGEDDRIVLHAIEMTIAEKGIVPHQLLKQSLPEQLSANYELIVHRLLQKGLVEEVYDEGFDLGLRKICL